MDPPERYKDGFGAIFLKPPVEEEGEYEAVEDICFVHLVRRISATRERR